MWNVIVEQWQTRTSLAGCSAGAMAFGETIMGIRKSNHSAGLNLLPGSKVIPHYDKMMGWLPDSVASFIARAGASTTLVGIDENTAIVHDKKWRVVCKGRVRVLRGTLDQCLIN